MAYTTQIGGSIPSDIVYEHKISIQLKWDNSIINMWVFDTVDQRTGWCTIYPDMEAGFLQVMFSEKADLDLFNSTFDFAAWDASR
ncbi:MAG: hypothetical protein HC836_37655 [Richelia sp. RM2_1_2]|nr:hypothetical protein [Richelia sp. RM2_1_2]